MQTVWKFPIKIDDVQRVDMPAGAYVIHTGLDPQGEPCIWAKVTPGNALVEHTLYVTGTGAPAPDDDNRHVGSFSHGPFMWHVWIPF